VAKRSAQRGPAATTVATRSTRSAGRAVATELGRVVRGLREEQSLTLADVATRADISPAMLSRLETGQTSPSLETIVSLAGALGVRPSLLLRDLGEDDDSAQHVPAGYGMEVVRRGTRRGHTYHLLAAQRGPRKVFEPFLVTLTDKSELFPGFEHAGTEFIHVLSGQIAYRHGRNTYLLKPGDSLTFRGDVAHGPERLIKVPIRMLSVIMYGDGKEG
jgi:transcriptional regulator with XRE-family HTH domain